MLRLNNSQSIFLDFLRLSAVQFVVLGHAINFFSKFKIEWLQNLAVVIFFILSGLVISYSTIYKMNNAAYSLKEYAIERFSRIYAALIPCLIFIVCLDWLSIYLYAGYQYHDSLTVTTFMANILMLQDFPFQHVFTSLGSGRPLWTLAIEWWMYMAFGFLVLKFMNKFSWRYLPLFLFCLIVPIYHIIGRGNSLTLFWIFGVIITISIPYFNKLINNNIYLLCSLFIFLFFIRLYVTKDSYDVACAILLSLIISLMLIYLSRIEVLNSYVPVKSIKFAVKYSFTLYLIHYTILCFLGNLLSKYNISDVWKIIIGMVVCNIIAKLWAIYFEEKYKEITCFLKKL
jgi:peptidoglycan/LPS O-acetylase OafA/YrhL